jgi:DNA-binding MarR family transcriptional regulator
MGHLLVTYTVVMAAGRSKSDVPVPLLQTAEMLRHVISRWVHTTRDQAGTPSSARMETMALLDRSGPASIIRLAQHRSVKHQSMQLVIAQLENEGTVKKTTDPCDRRSQLISITAKGKRLLRDAQQARALWIAQLLQSNCTLQDLDDLQKAIAVLERVIGQTLPDNGAKTV